MNTTPEIFAAACVVESQDNPGQTHLTWTSGSGTGSDPDDQ
jgi:hypothetical protein